MKVAHGGKREGAGRKPSGLVPRNYWLLPKHLALIARWQREHGDISASEAVRQMIVKASEG
jgi:hypothetical protein